MDSDRWQQAVLILADAPRIENHPGQIADVVGMKMGEEHHFEPGEVQARADEGRWRPATAVDNEDAFVDDQR